jgi:lysyl-tRNA synthetase class 2
MVTLLERLTQRARITSAVRAFFDAQAFVEVDTAVALEAPAQELYIDAPEVTITGAVGPLRRFLQTSPELPMKRLLAAGLTHIYQIAPVFRDGDWSPCHRPEFRLLEWYRRGASWTSLLDDCEGLLRAAARAAGGDGGSLRVGDKSIDLERPFVRLSVQAAFVEHAGFSLLDNLESAALRARLDEHGMHHSPDDTWDDLFHRAYVARVEPALRAYDQPVFLVDYPAPLSALARRSPTDPRVAERFELFVAGMELANGFGELTDPHEQRARFVRERALRRDAGKRDYPLDERFLAALEELPPSAGIALGMERLFMLVTNASNIDAVSFIPWSET